MSLVVQDIGELAYGGLVTGLDRWDVKQARTLWKKYSTYAYLIPGIVATAATTMGWMRRYNAWTERLAHGFIYGFPGFVMDVVDHYGTTTTAGGRAVRDAESYLKTQRKPRQTAAPGFEGLRTY